MALDRLTKVTTSGITSTIAYDLDNINSTGIITASAFVGDGSGVTGVVAPALEETGSYTIQELSAVGVVTASTFVGDGSGLTGVTASGVGIEIKDSGSIVGVAGTIDFGTNLNVSPAAAGIVTITTGDSDFAINDKIVHTGNTNTALRFPAADTVTVETAGSERFRVESGGNIGIGTNDANNLLHVYGGQIKAQSNPSDTSTNLDLIRAQCGSSGNALFSIRAADAADNNSNWDIKTNANEDLTFTIGGATERLRITSDGNLGIGTQNPANELEVSGVISATELYVTSGGDTASNNISGKFSHGGINSKSLVIGADPNNVGGNTRLQFDVDGTERLRIVSSGNVGIGTDNPQALLHVNREISAGYEHITSLAHGVDRNFKLVTSNGSSSNSPGEPVGRLGINYEGTGWDAYAEWRRGNGAQDGSLRFVTSGGGSTPLILNADGTSTFANTINGTSLNLTSNIIQTASAPQHFFKETGTTYGNTTWSITRDSDHISIRWNNASPYAFQSQTSGGSVSNVQLKGGQLIIDGNNALDAICVYNTTTSGGANVNVASTGLVRRSTSSAKYKTNVETIEDRYSDALLNCRPVYYRSTCENDNPDYGWWGFIAEEVAEIDPRLVYYKEVNVALDGEGGKTETPCELEPEGVAYERFVPHLLNLIKRQKQAIETLESRVAALEAE